MSFCLWSSPGEITGAAGCGNGATGERSKSNAGGTCKVSDKSSGLPGLAERGGALVVTSLLLGDENKLACPHGNIARCASAENAIANPAAAKGSVRFKYVKQKPISINQANLIRHPRQK